MKLMFMLIVLLITSHHAIAEGPQTLTVGLINIDRPPYFWQATQSQPVRGLYPDLLGEISKQTGIKFEYRFLPQARIRHYMKHQKLDIEPGIDQTWRLEPGEAEATVYSVPFMDSEELYVYNKKRFNTVPSAQAQQDLEFCKILGFNETSMDSDSAKKHLSSERQILELLARQRCDYALFPKQVIQFFEHELNFPVLLSPPHHRYSLRLRVNKQHAGLLPEINKAIMALQTSGKLNELFDRYHK